MTTLFWGALAIIAWTYAGFPAWLLARARTRPRPLRGDDTWQAPGVSVIIAAHDEAASIGLKVRQVLDLDHEARIELIVASDGSTDETVAEARRSGGGRALVLDLPRLGKARALDAAIAESTGEILVFTDANSRLDHDALKHLLAPFADPTVGGVAGDQRYEPDHAGGQAHGERGYWDLDRMLKRAESAAGNVISATGALYAVRRELVGPTAEGVTDDFYISTGVIERGFRLVFADGAIAWEPPARSSGLEYERKVRIMTRGLRGVIERRSLLDPRRSGAYALQLLSHKVLRRLVAVPLLVLFVSSVSSIGRGRLYQAAATGQAVLYGLGAVGLAAGKTPVGRSKILQLPAYFCLVNAAALRAAINVAQGRRIDRWDTRRDDDADEPAGPSEPGHG